MCSSDLYARFWMHNGTVGLAGQKMSKSLGNLVKVSDLIERGHTGNGIRLLMLSVRYRDDRDFDEAELHRWEAAARQLERAARGQGGPPDRLRVEARRIEFQDVMDDDLDTPRAIEVLLGIARDLHEGTIAGDTGVGTLIELGEVLGLRLRPE